MNEVFISDGYAIIPNTSIERRVWLNLVIDLKSLYHGLYRGSTYKSLESIEISSVCKIRRIMTLNKHQM